MSKFTIQNNTLDWNTYLDELDIYLKERGFEKYKQNLKREDFSYWKKYDDKYQIGLLVYDFRKFNNIPVMQQKVSISYECMPLDGRCDLTVSMDIELDEFERMSESFYNSMNKYLKYEQNG